MKLETIEALEEYVGHKNLEAENVNAVDKNAVHGRYMEALKTLREVEKDQNDFYDKQERRDIDRESNVIEEQKSKMGIARVTVEILKIVVPSAIAAWAAIKMQNRAGQFEESGRWTTEAGRQAHRQTPNIWRK